MSVRTLEIVLFLAVVPLGALGDEVLYSYEGNVPPHNESAGWVIFQPCVGGCSSRVEDGHFVLEWVHGEIVNYDLSMSNVLDPLVLPSTLWVEWRFRSNQSFGGIFDGCDARFKVRYSYISDLVKMFGDYVISFSADDSMGGLNVEEFNTYRFVSLDGVGYRILVDGRVFLDVVDPQNTEGGYLQMGGHGACDPDPTTTQVNEWDFVRFGTISFGEQIVASDPPPGFLDARVHADLDRFTVTFDAPNYVEIDEISVETTRGDVPLVTHTRRRENDDVNTVEIVLDRPIPMGATTRFTFDDGVRVNVIEYTFAPGDTDGNGRIDLADLAVMQNCFGQPAPLPAPCRAIDFNNDESITLTDFAALYTCLTNQRAGEDRRNMPVSSSVPMGTPSRSTRWMSAICYRG